ncbi:MAG: hypothetical protein BZ137_09275, partial [Methanosphaera sp. rholeuAM130]
VAIIGFGCVSAADVDNNTITDAPTHTVEQQQNNNMIKDSPINTEKAVKKNINLENNTQQITDNTNASNIISSENMTLQDNKINSNDVSTNSTPQLNITGPKTNGSNLNIKGPKITGKNPKIALSQKSKDIYHYAKLFIQHPELTLFNLCDIVLNEQAYSWEETADIVAQAHNIALHKYQGNDMNVSYELTKQGVWDYMSQDMFLILRHSGRN